MAGGDQGSSVDPGRDGERSGKRKICWPHLEPLFPDGQVLLPIDFVISFVTFEKQRVQGYDIPVCQLVPQSTGNTIQYSEI